MHPINVKTVNNISPAGLALFGENFTVGADVVDPQAIIVRSNTIATNEYPHILAVARAGAGYNNISVPEATEKGVCVFNTPGANANAVAELVFFILGVRARNIHSSISLLRSLVNDEDKIINETVESQKKNFTGFEITGKTLGVIGLGKIGVLVANAGIGHNMKVIGYDAFPTIANIHQLDNKVELAKQMTEVLTQADILSVHVPFCPETKHMIDKKQIAQMKDEVILMNYARKGIYNDEAVEEALRKGKVNTYISDFPTKSLLRNSKVICTSHLGASTEESEENCATMAVKQLKNYLTYGTVTNSVNFPVMEAIPHPETVTRLAIITRNVDGMIASTSKVLGDAGINIEAFKNAGNGEIGYNLIDLNVEVPEKLIDRIRELENVLRVRVLKFSN